MTVLTWWEHGVIHPVYPRSASGRGVSGRKGSVQRLIEADPFWKAQVLIPSSGSLRVRLSARRIWSSPPRGERKQSYDPSAPRTRAKVVAQA
jgi:hypothetical protein